MNIATHADKITPLGVGQSIPQGPLTTMDGQATTLQEVIQKQASILIFYRGSWWRFCLTQLAGINNILSILQERGYTVLGICPDTSPGLQEVHSSRKLKFPLYSDSSLELSAQFGIAFHVDDETVSLYLNQYKIDLEKASGQPHHNLPVPSVFVVDKAGKILFAYSNADHTTRLSNEDLLTHAK